MKYTERDCKFLDDIRLKLRLGWTLRNLEKYLMEEVKLRSLSKVHDFIFEAMNLENMDASINTNYFKSFVTTKEIYSEFDSVDKFLDTMLKQETEKVTLDDMKDFDIAEQVLGEDPTIGISLDYKDLIDKITQDSFFRVVTKKEVKNLVGHKLKVGKSEYGYEILYERLREGTIQLSLYFKGSGDSAMLLGFYITNYKNTIFLKRTDMALEKLKHFGILRDVIRKYYPLINWKI